MNEIGSRSTPTANSKGDLFTYLDFILVPVRPPQHFLVRPSTCSVLHVNGRFRKLPSQDVLSDNDVRDEFQFKKRALYLTYARLVIHD